MRIIMSNEQRIAFRDWLRAQLRALEFYQKRGDVYLIREFHKYTIEQGHPIDEASLGRYINRDNPVIPTPETCRDFAALFGLPPVEVMKAAGLVKDSDWDDPATGEKGA